jgi:hypothetical protein
MSQVQPRKVRVALVSFLLGSIFHVAPALGATLTTQEFSGDFTLVNVSPILEDNVPDQTEYSGFVVYSEDGILSDWEVNINELDLNLNPDSTIGGSPFQPPETPNVNFELFSPSNWNLVIDFGIAFDAPRYTLERTSDSEITLTGELGLAGGYTYTDPTANITVSSSNTSVPEPTSLLSLLFAAGAIPISRKPSKINSH